MSSAKTLAIPAPLLKEAVLKEFPFARVSVRDAAYAVPMLRPLVADLKERIPATLTALGLSPAWTATFDCDKFAGLAKALVALRHAYSTEGDEAPPEGVAFAELLYRRRDGVGHAINLVFALDAGAASPGLYAVEPQTGEILALTESEKNSAWEVVL